MTYTQIFNEMCPTYLAFGMTYEQYWYGDPWMVRAYADAYLLKRKIENENMWIQGAYIANAMGAVMATSFGKRKVNYMDKPMDLFPKTEAEQQAEIREERRRLVNMLNGFKKKFSNKKKAGDQNAKP